MYAPPQHLCAGFVSLGSGEGTLLCTMMARADQSHAASGALEKWDRKRNFKTLRQLDSRELDNLGAS
jgi:hypothetical protein